MISWRLSSQDMPAGRKIRSLHQKRKRVSISRVKDLDLQQYHPARAGVILYTVKDGMLYFAVGTDSRTHDLTDFGGHVEYHRDIDAVHGALREFTEETLGIFNPIFPEDIQECPAVHDADNLIIFIHVHLGSISLEEISQTFLDKYKNEVNPEVCSILWLTWSGLIHSLGTNGKWYTRVQKILSRAYDINTFL